jgi:hypothetical protein
MDEPGRHDEGMTGILHGRQRWFLRGFMKLSSLFSLFALFSARFSRMDLPAFLALPFLGDFPDIGITPFLARVTQYHTHFYFLSQSCKTCGISNQFSTGFCSGAPGL